MTIAFFSDVHGNLPALEAVLADMDRRRPDMIFCLGDLVGYATWPNEVVNEVRRRGIPTLAGPCDRSIAQAHPSSSRPFKADLKMDLDTQSLAYTNHLLEPDERRYLRYLPMRLLLIFQLASTKLSLHLVHDSPPQINAPHLEGQLEETFPRMLEESDADILIVGDTHKPYHHTISHVHEEETHFRHVLHIGSVGKPQDGDPRAAYQLLYLDENTRLTNPHGVRAEVVRVAYDVELAAQAIEISPFPDEYADRLRKAY
jgi:predicted phosphodiesterase